MSVMYACMCILSDCFVLLDAVELWDVDGKFQIKVTRVTNLNVSKETSVSTSASQWICP